MTEQTTLLIVDDDESVRNSLGLWLRSEGFSVLTAACGSEALELLAHHEVAVSLVDLKLGEEDGLKVCADLVAADRHLKVLTITAFPGYDTAILAMKSGITDYISKAEDNEAILAKIQAAVAARQAEQAEAAAEAADCLNLALFCRHALVHQGLETFCTQNPQYRIQTVFTHHQRLAKSDYSPNRGLCLICTACHREQLTAHSNELCARLKTAFPNMEQLVFDCDLDDDTRLSLLAAGVKGFLAVNASVEDMKTAWDGVLAGQIWAEKRITDKLLTQLLQQRGEATAGRTMQMVVRAPRTNSHHIVIP